MVTIDMVKTGENISRLMKKNGLSASDLAEALYLTPAAIYKWKRGSSVPSPESLASMADLFEVKMEDILAIKKVDANGKK